jgi:hypothetical protein
MTSLRQEGANSVPVLMDFARAVKKAIQLKWLTLTPQNITTSVLSVKNQTVVIVKMMWLDAPTANMGMI